MDFFLFTTTEQRIKNWTLWIQGTYCLSCIDWLIDWFTIDLPVIIWKLWIQIQGADWSHCWVHWLIDWLIHFINWLVDLLLIKSPVHRFNIWKLRIKTQGASWIDSWVVDWLIHQSIDWFTGDWLLKYVDSTSGNCG